VTKPSLLRYEELTTVELDRMDRDRTLFLIPLSLLEEHGPHLPLGSDLFIAQYMAEAVALGLQRETLFDNLALMPGIPVGAGGIAMTGSIESDMTTVRQLLVEYGKSLSKYGFRYSLVTSGHAGRRHLMALEAACVELNEALPFQMLPLGSRLLPLFKSGGFLEGISRRLGRSFSAEELAAFARDGHAGWWETSLMLLIRPDLVRGEYLHLPGSEVLCAEGYHGFPARASIEFARAATDEMVEFSIGIIRQFFRLPK
jgi:creatinine amidohydrolase